MNRRSIFKLLAGAACAAAMEITGLAPVLPKAAKWVVNPEWSNASYEDAVFFNHGLFVDRHPDQKKSFGHVIRYKRAEGLPSLSEAFKSSDVSPDSLIVLNDAYPNRYAFANGEYQPIPRYILES